MGLMDSWERWRKLRGVKKIKRTYRRNLFCIFIVCVVCVFCSVWYIYIFTLASVIPCMHSADFDTLTLKFNFLNLFKGPERY